MKNQADYSKYKCPYEHLEKECGHDLRGPEGFENTYGVWCECGFRGPVFYLSPEELRLEAKPMRIDNNINETRGCDDEEVFNNWTFSANRV